MSRPTPHKQFNKKRFSNTTVGHLRSDEISIATEESLTTHLISHKTPSDSYGVFPDSRSTRRIRERPITPKR